MFEYVAAVGIVAVVVTVLMVAAMLYLVWDSMGEEAHTSSPDESDQPELDEGEETTETQGELTADGSST